MTQSTEQRLAAAERQLSELRVQVAELDMLVQVLLCRDAPGNADTDRIKKSLKVMREASPRGRGAERPQLRLVSGADSVCGQDMDEGLRRVRAARGEGR
ncbi:hypothetical protein [Streptomyces sp. UG1]|uniref:hypothetical protein n=1 Tax=Streptomyces sp. UG1 TaxID=3417652 RepID=UPI003CEF4164